MGTDVIRPINLISLNIWAQRSFTGRNLPFLVLAEPPKPRPLWFTVHHCKVCHSTWNFWAISKHTFCHSALFLKQCFVPLLCFLVCKSAHFFLLCLTWKSRTCLVCDGVFLHLEWEDCLWACLPLGSIFDIFPLWFQNKVARSTYLEISGLG